MNVSMLMPEPFQGRHDQYLRHYLETGEKKVVGKNREVEAMRKNGSPFLINEILDLSKVEAGMMELNLCEMIMSRLN
jgi:PAS domain S-box-containing protein